jgi:glycosyltransferase involved in cell wall biosynthesis
VRFVGGIYDFNKLNSVRYYSYAYFHGHSVGGTNPSLLEAMASECFILSHDNVFNRAVLGGNAIYYKGKDDVARLLNDIQQLEESHKQDFLQKNLEVIRTQYSWEKLVDEHEKYFQWMLEDAKRKNSK